MSAVEEIQQAVNRLVKLRDECSFVAYSDGSLWRTVESVCIDGGPNLISNKTNDPLFVTLYCTIDAQLAILRYAVQQWEAVEREGSPDFLVRHVEGYMHDHELALARAINEAS